MSANAIDYLKDTGGQNLSNALLEELGEDYETTWMSDALPIVEVRHERRERRQMFVAVTHREVTPRSGLSSPVVVISTPDPLSTTVRGRTGSRTIELPAATTTIGQIARTIEKMVGEREIGTRDVAGKLLFLARYKLTGGRFRPPLLVCAATEKIARKAASEHWHVIEKNIEVDEATEEEKGRHEFVVLAPKRVVPIDDFLEAYGAIR